MLGNVVHRRRHLVDGSCGLVGLALLAEHAVAHIAHARRQPRGTGVQLRGGVGDGADHAVVGRLHGVEGPGHLADLVATGQWHAGRQVAGFFHVQHHVLEGVELAEQEADQQLRGAKHGQHQDQHAHRIIGEALEEHLAQAWRLGQHGHLLIAAAQHLRAAQRVVAEDPGVWQFDPALGVSQGIEGFAGKGGRLPGRPADDVGRAGQGLPGRPGGEQLGLRGCLGLHCFGAGALLQMHGIEHQQQGGDKGHRVDGPELVLQGNIA
ncbi:hypothetical protein D9M71_380550 [compost metagenome]